MIKSNKPNIVRILIYIVSLAGNCLLVMGQEADSLVFFKELSYKSDYEKKAFESINSKNPDYISLFLCIADSCSNEELIRITEKINNQISIYKNPKFTTESEKKKIKKIYSDIHSAYFEKYSIDGFFDELFTLKIFNCVTASAFYGIILQELGIPFTVKVSFNHVYLITYPETYSLVIETTDPLSGFKYYNEEEKLKFAEFLKNAKLISEVEYSSKGADQLFNEFFFKEEDANLLNLAGLQYYNKSLETFDSKNFIEAYNLAEKSYFLFPEERAGWLILVTIANILNNCDYNDIKYADYIVEAARLEKYGPNSDIIYDQFIDVTHKLLINNYDTALYDQYYTRIHSGLSDSSLLDRIAFVYYYERGRLLFNDQKTNRSLFFIEEAMEINPKNADARGLFIAALLLSFEQCKDIEKKLADMEVYADRFPELMQNEKFVQIRCLAILGRSIESFISEDFDEAFASIVKFEAAIEFSGIKISGYFFENSVTEAYSRAASYYYRKGNYKMSKNYLTAGLKYVPSSYELMQKLKQLE